MGYLSSTESSSILGSRLLIEWPLVSWEDGEAKGLLDCYTAYGPSVFEAARGALDANGLKNSPLSPSRAK